MSIPSPRQLHLTLLDRGMQPDEAARQVERAWTAIQERARRADPYEFSSPAAYLAMMVDARLPTPEIEALARSAVRWEADLTASEEERKRRIEWEAEEEREEVRREFAFGRIVRRLAWDITGGPDPDTFLDYHSAEPPEPPPEPDPRFGPWQP